MKDHHEAFQTVAAGPLLNLNPVVLCLNEASKFGPHTSQTTERLTSVVNQRAGTRAGTD